MLLSFLLVAAWRLKRKKKKLCPRHSASVIGWIETKICMTFSTSRSHPSPLFFRWQITHAMHYLLLWRVKPPFSSQHHNQSTAIRMSQILVDNNNILIYWMITQCSVYYDFQETYLLLTKSVSTILFRYSLKEDT